MRYRLGALAILLGTAASLAGAQNPPAPPPLPPAVSPATPAPTPGLVTQSPAGAEARAAEPKPSRWQADLERLDTDLRLRLLSANEPRSEWLAGELEDTDIVSQVRHYTAARTAAPQERLYQASLATACLTRVRPPLDECEAVDRLSDWARRDADNGVPSMLLADRARQRGEIDSAASHLEQAGSAPRFDDYWSQGALHWWDYLRTLAIDVDPAAKAEAAANYATAHDLMWTTSLRTLCADSRGRTDRMKLACARLGDALTTRGATFALRRAGARIAEINAADTKGRASAQSAQARILEATARCAQAQPDFETALESSAPATRARGVEQFAAWASAQARDGEVRACERLGK